jgi:hypothetical protein
MKARGKRRHNGATSHTTGKGIYLGSRFWFPLSDVMVTQPLSQMNEQLAAKRLVSVHVGDVLEVGF